MLPPSHQGHQEIQNRGKESYLVSLVAWWLEIRIRSNWGRDGTRCFTEKTPRNRPSSRPEKRDGTGASHIEDRGRKRSPARRDKLSRRVRQKWSRRDGSLSIDIRGADPPTRVPPVSGDPAPAIGTGLIQTSGTGRAGQDRRFVTTSTPRNPIG